jgi:mannose-6-phosphate isomerase
LHEDNGVAVANAWPLRPSTGSTRLSDERTLLVASRHFVLERLDLTESTSWALLAEPETWILVLDGHAAVGLTAISAGQAIFAAGGRSSIEVGANGMTALVAYPATAPVSSLLHRLGKPSTDSVAQTAIVASQLADGPEART